MLSRSHLTAALLGLFLAGPAIADDRPPGRPSAAYNIAALTAESDFTVFMRKDVPEEVRRAALRRLWVLMRLPVSCDDLCYDPEPAGFRLRAGRERDAVRRQPSDRGGALATRLTGKIEEGAMLNIATVSAASILATARGTGPSFRPGAAPLDARHGRGCLPTISKAGPKPIPSRSRRPPRRDTASTIRSWHVLDAGVTPLLRSAQVEGCPGCLVGRDTCRSCSAGRWMPVRERRIAVLARGSPPGPHRHVAHRRRAGWRDLRASRLRPQHGFRATAPAPLMGCRSADPAQRALRAKTWIRRARTASRLLPAMPGARATSRPRKPCRRR